MLIGFPIVLVIGWLAGVLVNALADDLPYRRRVGRPTYPDGTPRDVPAWSGIVAFLTHRREPAQRAPDETRERGDGFSARLAWRYPLTEVLTIGLMLLAYVAAFDHPSMTELMDTDPTLWLLQLGFWLVYMLLFALIIVIDIEHKLILFVVIIPSLLIALTDAVILPSAMPNLRDALIGAAVGFGIFFLLYQGGFIFTYLMGKIRGRPINTVAFGYGDVMLITLSGALLGLSYTTIALFITVFLGALGAFIFIVARAFLGGRYSLFTAIPYGPYIVAATTIMLLFGPLMHYQLMDYWYYY